MKNLSSLLGALGVVFVVFGLLSAALLLLQPVTDPGWIWGNLVIGVLLLGVAVATSFDSIRERISSGEGRRVGKFGTSALLTTLLGVAILGMLAFLSVRYNEKWDWSAEKVHTLTQQSLGLLEGLDRDVVVTAFFAETDAPAVRELLERYSDASPRLSLRFVDPNANPALIAELAIDEEKLARGLIQVESAGQTIDVTEISESGITNTLLKLTSGGEKRLYFVQGHNERPIEGEPGAGKEGMTRVAAALRNETYQVDELLLAAMGEVPEDASAVVLAGPTRPYLEQEHGALERYLERGGALLVMLDPRANTDLYEDLERWGIRVGDDVIVDQSLALFGRATSPFAGSYGQHPITDELREPTLFHMARSVELAPGASDSLETIVMTGDASWAERDLAAWRETGRAAYDERDLMGPVPVAVAGTPTLDSDGAGRIVVFGDSDFASNEFLDGFRNQDLLLNSVNWLVGDVEQISLRPHLARASRFQMTQEQFQRIQVLSLFVIPEAIAVLGVVVWWWRRNP